MKSVVAVRSSRRKRCAKWKLENEEEKMRGSSSRGLLIPFSSGGPTTASQVGNDVRKVRISPSNKNEMLLEIERNYEINERFFFVQQAMDRCDNCVY